MNSGSPTTARMTALWAPLYTISVQTQEQLDEYQTPGAENHYFAKNDEKGLYYSFGPGGGFTAYRSDDHDTEALVAEYEAYFEIQYTALAESIIAANGLVSFTGTDFEAIYGPRP